MKMARILIVSNRLPVTASKSEGKINFVPSVGGLATGISSFHQNHDCLWIGWSGIARDEMSKDNMQDIIAQLERLKNYPVFLSQSQIESYYDGFCNKTIWSLFHSFTQYTIYDNVLWDEYKKVNKIFCQTILAIIKPDDIIWIHDYQLMLLPMLLRQRIPNLTIGFFLHIPFPPQEIYRQLPWRREILEGILGADLIGFHTYDYVRNFLDSELRLLGDEQNMGYINYQNRMLKVDSFPMGIDYERFSMAIQNTDTQREVEKIRKQIGRRKIILSIDRMDYTKGIVERLKAYEIFLQENPEYFEKVTLIMLAVPSRTRVEQYQHLKHQIDELIGKINGKYGSIGWVPIWYLFRSLPFSELSALYHIADIALITPLKDGMNLVAKEFIASKDNAKGVLILSEMAGAAHELGEALIVNPNNGLEISWALKYALHMSEAKQIKRNKIMQKRLKNYDVKKWADDFKKSLIQVKEKQEEFSAKIFTPKKRLQIIKDYQRSKNRLFLLDYDGTLVNIEYKFKTIKPGKDVLNTIQQLIQDKKNQVVIVSGRGKEILEKWFKDIHVGLIAEHGALLRKNNRIWETAEPFKKEWKQQIKPLLQLYVDRTPGSFIEEKEYSLVWHYIKTNPSFGQIRALELRDALLHLTSNLNLEVLHGRKVIEIKPMGINKGITAYQWISQKDWDFIMAIGDDWSDEDTFATLPDTAYSIKVGAGSSQSKYNINSSTEVRAFLRELSKK